MIKNFNQLKGRVQELNKLYQMEGLEFYISGMYGGFKVVIRDSETGEHLEELTDGYNSVLETLEQLEGLKMKDLNWKIEKSYRWYNNDWGVI